jgi:hypothetical protein
LPYSQCGPSRDYNPIGPIFRTSSPPTELILRIPAKKTTKCLTICPNFVISYLSVFLIVMSLLSAAHISHRRRQRSMFANRSYHALVGGLLLRIRSYLSCRARFWASDPSAFFVAMTDRAILAIRRVRCVRYARLGVGTPPVITSLILMTNDALTLAFPYLSRKER